MVQPDRRGVAPGLETRAHLLAEVLDDRED